jgi:pimeloyl-ACP methyl ester carboxylesterase
MPGPLLEQHREMTCRIVEALHARPHAAPSPVWRPHAEIALWESEDAITPRSRLVVIQNCGHMPVMEKPAEFARLAENFMAG